MELGLIITFAGLGVAGFSSLLGMWLERDASKPKKITLALSLLIVLATGVGMFQAMLDNAEQDKMKEDMARMLATLDKIANSSDVAIPELNDLVKGELAAQSRSNPEIVQKMAQRVADEGGDPSEVLGSYLPASEMQKIGRKGSLEIKKPAVAVMSVGKPAEKPRNRERPTLSDVASGKAPLPGAAPKVAAPPPSEPPSAAAAAPATEAAPPSFAAAAPKALMAKAPAPMKALMPKAATAAPIPKMMPSALAKPSLKSLQAAAPAPAAAAAAKADEAKKKAEELKKLADANAAKQKAADEAKKKADEAKKKAEAAKKKAIEDAKKKIPGGLF